MVNDRLAPVITIDGPSASGKGTLAKWLARYLHWHLLDSGALYRAFAWGFVNDYASQDSAGYQQIISRLRVDYSVECNPHNMELYYGDELISQAIRTERWAQMASQLGAVAEVRQMLLPLQRQARRFPGLVADGRDMGTCIFPDAVLKFYLDADVEARVQRRYNQLKLQGIHVNLKDVRNELMQRDYRDAHRMISPAARANDMIWIDTTSLTIEQVCMRMSEQVSIAI